MIVRIGFVNFSARFRLCINKMNMSVSEVMFRMILFVRGKLSYCVIVKKFNLIRVING